MSKKRKCCIVIPIYKEELTDSEERSLKQVVNVLSEFDFYFVCPENFDATAYLNQIKAAKNISCSLSIFKKYYFSSIEGYNKLLITPRFYSRFSKYDFMLIYQLDAWVFKNELEFWCAQGYDYIGAPWFVGQHEATEQSAFLGVGNGGFSLRNIKSHLKVLRSFKYIVSIKELYTSHLKNFSGTNTIKFIKNITVKNNTYHLLNDYSYQEDYFWGFIVSKRFFWFKVPSPEIALKFSMEVNSPLLFKKNNYQLPFGCHAWEKYEPSFWEKFIL